MSQLLIKVRFFRGKKLMCGLDSCFRCMSQLLIKVRFFRGKKLMCGLDS